MGSPGQVVDGKKQAISKPYAPYVKECMMCPANKDDVRKSFDHPHKCHHDKHRKHGILMHDDDVPMPMMPDEE